MPFSVEATTEFLSEAKRLAKKYSSLKTDLTLLIQDLSLNPQRGTPIGKNAYKIRLAITSKGKGKSGRARIITCVKVISEKVYLVSIYDKSEQSNISDKDLRERIRNIK